MRLAAHTTILIVVQHTAISKKVVIVNSRYWNRKELWVFKQDTVSVDVAKYIVQVLHLCHSHTVITFTGALSLITTVPKVPFGSSIDY